MNGEKTMLNMNISIENFKLFTKWIGKMLCVYIWSLTKIVELLKWTMDQLTWDLSPSFAWVEQSKNIFIENNWIKVSAEYHILPTGLGKCKLRADILH